MVELAALVVLAIAIGSIPNGYLLARAMGIDIRTQGSGNVGATNVGRALGKKAGIITLLLDISKGVLVVMLANSELLQSQLQGGGPIKACDLPSILGAAAVFGHCFSPFLKFKGGKGVATGIGVFLCLAPQAALLCIVAFAITVKLSGFVSLGSVAAALTLPISLLSGIPVNYGMATAISGLLVGGLVLFRHRQNIARLIKGNEPSLKKKDEA